MFSCEAWEGYEKEPGLVSQNGEFENTLNPKWQRDRRAGEGVSTMGKGKN